MTVRRTVHTTKKFDNAWIKQSRASATSLEVPLFVNRYGQPFNGNTMQKLMKGMYERAVVSSQPNHW